MDSVIKKILIEKSDYIINTESEHLYSKEALKSLNILYIENNDATRTYLCKVLKSLVNKVQSVSNGYDAKKIFKTFAPDLILTDMKMPKINGIEFIQFVRELNKSIPIIIISSFIEEADLLYLVNCKISGYLTKPVSSSNLISKLIDVGQDLINRGKLRYRLNNKLSFDINNYSLEVNNSYIKLNYKEALLIHLLTQNPNRIVSYSEIESTVWNGYPMTRGAIKTLVNSVVKKAGYKFIINISQYGYKLEKKYN